MRPRVVSLFSGGGGLDLGFKSEGYEIVWASDNNQDAVATYRANIDDKIVCADINQVNVNDIPENVDIIIGGPPCQSFSLAGKRNVTDARGQLIWTYLKILKHVKPKAFLFENVLGLLSAKDDSGAKIFDNLCAQFHKIGYHVTAKVLNAADYGVPQLRKRVIVVGLRSGEEFQFPRPTHSPDGGSGTYAYVSTSDALASLPPLMGTAHESCVSRTKRCKEYLDFVCDSPLADEHDMPPMSQLDCYIASHVRPGGNYMDLPKDIPSRRVQRLQREGGHTTCYGRLHPDRPSHTINTYFNRPNVGCNIHYKEDRLITIREALRLQSFPDSYRLVSRSKAGKCLIVGNAVPPLLAKSLARQLKQYLQS